MDKRNNNSHKENDGAKIKYYKFNLLKINVGKSRNPGK